MPPATPSQLRCSLWRYGTERLAARADARSQILRGLGGPVEVTSPLFSVASILNANWYEKMAEEVAVILKETMIQAGKAYLSKVNEWESSKYFLLSLCYYFYKG